MERALEKGFAAAITLIVIATIVGCVGLTASQKLYLKQNPECWFDEDGNTMCPSPFEKEIKKEAELLEKSIR